MVCFQESKSQNGGLMSANVPFKCRCGSEQFETKKPVRSIDDLVGAECSKCKRVMTRRDIEDQAKKIAEKAIKSALKLR
ncbi:peptide chain release factor 1 [Pseudomonas sp. FW306-02-F02-AA]|uniref:Uncharacterized protein n=2 Tax=Pseudomonas TaxID=286 RepID=A0A0N9WI60_PSEFL|nr:hypothetical protein AO353_26465 [Pseudomonas fluorescens]PMZ03908.1 peptide chain release factor 1 [Pseudomonas sp. FW306-02-F02-AB]PMZ08273.1 peptide chain release factor 1 [Pseudomonas sp. FW306-02-H06C]PMZ14013.1 peptide chain release factor 1 [Pseudomonas sp. FW306-02-F02-AA]PMZ21478.1 peptide chain release factor 1 [Pseudomonas sp. FW306-02-F08-AA]PMZ25796.1 peptide chain release factor 1 [Pseudomonas sp. FW306-02-F04-BA]PMZ32755.1 peptide chain release factor 1 [Pseudomonas sp. FW30